MEEHGMARSTEPNRDSGSDSKSRKKQKKKKRWFWRTVKIFLFLFLAAGVIGGGAGAGYVATLLKKAPPLDLNTITNMAATTKVYDADQQFMFDLQGDGDRELIKSLDEVSPHVVNAFIAAEDKDFRSHFGINPMALARATVQNVLGRSIMSGASTITQQTVKNAMFPEQSRTLERKVQEMYLAIELEKQLTKDEILVTYLNWIYFGKSGPDNLYGIQRASQAIFGVNAKDLTLAQSTILAALPNNPSLFNPYVNLENTLGRQEYILQQMMAAGYITQAQYEEAKAFNVAEALQQTQQNRRVNAGEFGHLVAEIETRAAERLMDSGNYESLDQARQALFRGGYQIFTTIERDYQKMVDSVINDNKFYPKNITYTITDNTGKQTKIEDAMEQSGAALIDNKTGRVLALGGGRNYEVDQVNHATVPRQPGSTMKPIAVYGPAIERGLIGSGTAIDDVPMVWPDRSSASGTYFPFNWDKRFHGLMTVREALEQSYNIPALKVYHDITPSYGLGYLTKMGVTTLDDSDYNLASGIGGMAHGLTVLEATSSYSTMPNAGVWRDSFMIEEIKDRTGAVTYKHQSQETQVYDPNTAYILNDMLQGVVRRGTASEVGRKFPGYAIAGKTGTTNEDKDAWFIGYTPDVTLGIWVGYNMPYPLLKGEGNTPKHIWNAIMGQVLPTIENRTKEFFPNPGGVRQVAVCKVSGHLPTELCHAEHTVTNELFRANAVPRDACDVHVKAKYYEVNGKKYLANDSTPAHLVKEGIFIKRDKYTLPNGNRAYLPLDHEKELPSDKDPRAEDDTLRTTKVPSGLKATPASSTSVTLSWSAVAGAKGYVILRADSEAGPFQVINETTALTFTDSGLTTGNTYAYRVVSQGEDGMESDPSPSVTVTLGKDQPDNVPAPGNVNAKPAVVGAVVSWSPVSGAESYAIYRSTESNGDAQRIATAKGNGYNDVSALPGATYYYRVAALIDGKEGSPSMAAKVSLSAGGGSGGDEISPPRINDIYSTGSGNTLQLSWTPVQGAVNYVVERSTDGGSFKRLGTTSGTAYTDSNLESGKTYSYRVRSVSAGGSISDPSAPAKGTP